MVKKIKIILSWLFVIAAMTMIFNFSAQSSTQSSTVSHGVVVEVLDVVMDKEDITDELVAKVHFPVRKMAHFGIYMLLGFTLLNAFSVTVPVNLLINSLISFAFSVIYAISDEIHQGYSEGRGPSAVDVIIDSFGALIGILLLVVVIVLNKKITSKKLQ